MQPLFFGSLTTPLRLNLHEFSDQTLQAASTASTGCQLLARRHIVPCWADCKCLIAVDINDTCNIIYYIYTVLVLYESQQRFNIKHSILEELSDMKIHITISLKIANLNWEKAFHTKPGPQDVFEVCIPKLWFKVPFTFSTTRIVSVKYSSQEGCFSGFGHNRIPPSPSGGPHLITQPSFPDTNARHWERPEYQLGPTWHQLWQFDTNLKLSILGCQQFSTNTEAIILV